MSCPSDEVLNQASWRVSKWKFEAAQHFFKSKKDAAALEQSQRHHHTVSIKQAKPANPVRELLLDTMGVTTSCLVPEQR